MEIAIERVELRFAAGVHTSYGELGAREIVLLSLWSTDGMIGHGEAAPLEAYDGVSVDDVLAALAVYRPLLERADELRPGDLLEACRERADLPQALAAVDLALWDLAGRREARPVCELLCDSPAKTVAVNATITALDRAGAASQAAAAVLAGYRCVKLKVGVGDDADRVAAVRAAIGPDVALRLDANGAWGVEQARRTIEMLGPAGLELVEEPVHGLEATRRLREQVAVRIAIDETAAEPGALAGGAADAVCLKIGRCGGITGLLAAAAVVRASGAEVYVASTFDGPLGIAAGLHAAAALAPLPACGLATLDLFDPVDDRLAVRDGSIAVPGEPGLLADRTHPA
ncbi:MAG TPA: mandelate racemase/muconate lactonizing enzyme family protein [Solirubrobacteraceae bacterium]|jgi:L-alanine-DL-glutamate epimerase-like enolase superfamily enzyme|nr:mandelate racemase/muconate lactonizing enzyme family protein [Solirubrobacteraceae bacterium]